LSKVVILDRDGVINHDSDTFIRNPEQWQPIPGSLEAMGKLTGAGYRIVVATNQSAIKRRLLDMHTLNRIHARLLEAAAEFGAVVDAIFFCPCLPRDNCDCYKPNPGMLNDVAHRLGIDLGNVPFIGDSLRDVRAAQAAGAQPHLVLTGNGRDAAADPALGEGVTIHDDLASAAGFLLGKRTRAGPGRADLSSLPARRTIRP